MPDYIETTHAWGRSKGRADIVGSHREHCLCFEPCRFFHPGEERNCRIAERIFQTCQQENVVTPVYECPKFEPLTGE